MHVFKNEPEIELMYTNWRGETRPRRISAFYIWFGNSVWHHEPQWLLHCFDKDICEVHDFAIKGIHLSNQKHDFYGLIQYLKYNNSNYDAGKSTQFASEYSFLFEERSINMLDSRRLGSQGLHVSSIGLGCMGMSQWYGEADDLESIRTIHRAMELGVTLFDSAEAYGPYENEVLLGKALKGRREKAVVATKFGFDLKDGAIVGVDSRPEHISRVVEASLRRIETDHIDILYQHRFDPTVPIEDVVGAMSRLVSDGKVRYLGLCEVGVETIRRAHAIHPLSVVQSEYSIWERNLEEDILPLIRELDIGLVGFCPLGRGFLTGGVSRAESYPADDFRSHDPRLQGVNYDRNVAVADKLREIAARIDLRPSQLAIAWVLHQGRDIVPIPGTKRRSYLEENLASSAIALSTATLTELDALIQTVPVAGPRYNERMMAMIDR